MSYREYTRLDVRLYILPDLPHQLGTSDWPPLCGVVTGIYLKNVSAEEILVVVKVFLP
jgi:hypothetical protein